MLTYLQETQLVCFLEEHFAGCSEVVNIFDLNFQHTPLSLQPLHHICLLSIYDLHHKTLVTIQDSTDPAVFVRDSLSEMRRRLLGNQK